MKNCSLMLLLTVTIASTMSSCDFAQLSNNASAADIYQNMEGAEGTKQGRDINNVYNWPKSCQMAVEEITKKYGKPNGIMADELIWTNAGVWKKISITKVESKHNFPIEHTDMMQTTIMYKVPQTKMDELAMFDGSIVIDRTQGTISVRCDKEANNFLALNLANDIITNKISVEQARLAYGNIIKQKMRGENPEYMEKLIF